ncbi:MAG: hypothetical protein J5J06_19715 [Phycisphaerae bacterium]|nr:hypothetical protein [Phycisphaerae bacterium]
MHRLPFLPPRRQLSTCALAVVLAATSAPAQTDRPDNPLGLSGDLLQAILQPGVSAAADRHASNDDSPIPGSVPEVSINDRGNVQLHVAGVPLSTVLQLLSVQSRRNIIASPNVKGTVTANLFDVTFDEALEAVLSPNGATYATRGNFVYVYTKSEFEAMNAARTEPPVTRVFRLSYLSASDAKAYLDPLLEKTGSVVNSPPSSAGVAGGGGSSTEGNAWAEADLVVVTAPPSVMEQVESLIHQLDVRPRQVLVEATILRANLSDENALGIDFTMLGGVDLELLGATSRGIQNLTLGQLPTARFEKFNSNVSTDFAGDVPSGGISVGILKDQVAVFVRALEQYTDTTVLANPKVLALNKQKAQVIVGRRDGYLTTTVTQTQAIQTVEFLETGTQLVFRPFIGDDGWIRVELHPEDSVGFVNAQGLPTEQTTEVTTNVLVRDKETILIGGLFREVTTDARNQVPLLGSIPILGQLFRSNNDSSAREEVIILLTINVIHDQDAYAEASRRQGEDIERMRIGQRRGLMWHGRDRMAHAWYNLAVEAFDAGKKDRALWYANLSLSNSNRYLPAIELRERILCERDWDAEGTATRSFLYQLIRDERGEPPAMFGRPPVTAGTPREESHDGDVGP